MSDLSDYPQVRIFLSVDLVGSTALKYEQHTRDVGPIEPWAKVIRNFYQNFDDAYNKICEEKKVIAPSIWKLLGDEIIYSEKLESWGRATLLIDSFKKCVIKIQETNTPLEKVGLTAKATAWCAGFPVRNAIHEKSKATDYIGPELDKGFRLTHFSSPSRMALSVELIEGLLTDTDAEHWDWNYHGRHGLKGVFEPGGYPIITTPCIPDPISVEEQKMLSGEITAITIKKFINIFLDNSRSSNRLYIIKDASEHPDIEFEDQFKRACSYYRDEGSQDVPESSNSSEDFIDIEPSPKK